MISIITSVYNDRNNLNKCIKSVINQTYNKFEFIIIDDGSTDNSLKIINDFAKKDNRIKIIINQKNLGLTKSLNKGIRKSRYNFIARLDSDDWWEKGKLKKQLDFLLENKEYGIVGTNVIIMNRATGKRERLDLPENDHSIREMLLKTTPFVHSSIMFRKDIVPNGYNERFSTSQDYELYARILLKTKGYNLQTYLTHRSIYDKSSISYKKWKTQRLNRIKMRFIVFKAYKHSLLNYRYFLPDILILLIPSGLKSIKLKILHFLNNFFTF